MASRILLNTEINLANFFVTLKPGPHYTIFSVVFNMTRPHLNRGESLY